MRPDFEDFMIAPRRPAGIRVVTRLGRLIRKLDSAVVAYRVWFGGDDQCRLQGWGRLAVEMSDDKLWCRVNGDVARPSAFEFVFHTFWLTRRGMSLAAFQLAENLPPERLGPLETLILFPMLHNRALRKEAEALRARYLAMSARRRRADGSSSGV